LHQKEHLIKLFFVYERYRTNRYDSVYTIEEPPDLAGEFEETLSRKFNWTEEFIAHFENKRRFGNHEVSCGKHPTVLMDGASVRYPNNIVEFNPGGFCKG